MIDNSYAPSNDELVIAINNDLQQFAARWRSDKTVGTHEPVDAFCDVLLRGGKRLRGMLTMQSYYAHGGRDPVVAIGAARVFEIIQTSLLIADDIADRSALRRGGPSAHTRITAYARAHSMKGDASHYGQMQAMNVAYAGLHKATIELLELPIDAETACRACKRFHENIVVTVNGQIDDIHNMATSTIVTEADIESVLVRKSAHYTILSPLELGASLAGAGDLPQSLQDYAIHAGCAFQIVDDIISTFGHERETGKESNDDIREGKLTLLAHYALSRASEQQKRRLSAVLGKTDATNTECNEVREIIKTTGALQHAKERLHHHEKTAIQVLKNDTAINPEFKNYLVEITDYIVNRQF